MLLEWWPQSLVSAVATCFCWPVLRWFSTRWLSILVLLELLGCLGCSFRHVEAGAVQDALPQGQLCALGGSQFQGERSGRSDTRVRGARQRCRSDAARVQRGPVWRRRGRSPTVKNAADCRGGGVKSKICCKFSSIQSMTNGFLAREGNNVVALSGGDSGSHPFGVFTHIQVSPFLPNFVFLGQ